MIILLQAKCQSPEEALWGHWAEVGIGAHSSHSSPGSTRSESSSGHCWDCYPCFRDEQTEVNAAAVTSVAIPCLKDRARLGIWLLLCPVLWLQAELSLSLSLPGNHLLPQTIQPDRTSRAQNPEKLLCRSPRQLHITLNLCHLPWSI